MPREPAYADKRSQDGEAQSASERATGRMPVASVRRRGMGSPEPRERPATGHGQSRATRRAARIARAIAAS